MPDKDYYAVLGVERTATEKEIHRSFRKQSPLYHPDRNQSPAAEDKFKALSEAYAILGDPERRAKYDLERSFVLEDLVQPDAQPLVSCAFDFSPKDGDEILINAFGFLRISVGVAKKIIFDGEAVSSPQYTPETNFLDARGFQGNVTLPRNVNLKLYFGIYDGVLEGKIAHEGELSAHNSRVNLVAVGNLGINVGLENYNARDYNIHAGDYSITGLKHPDGYKYVSPFLPNPPRWLKLNSEKSRWDITYNKPS